MNVYINLQYGLAILTLIIVVFIYNEDLKRNIKWSIKNKLRSEFT